MNKYAMQHIVDSSYCFPVSEDEMVLRLRTAKDDIVKAEVLYEGKYVIEQRQQKAELFKAYEGELFDYYEVKLKLQDTRLAYVFRISDGQEECYLSEDGVTSGYDFSNGVYHYFQYPYINPADVVYTVPWMKEATFYQIFVDRFCRGDYEKDDSYIDLKWGDKPTWRNFAGGDLKGVIEKLDYIKSLGCNAIYLTPVFTSGSNHKYDITDYYQVDAQFGNNEDLHRLVKTAHEKGMRIVLDAVFNHCSDKSVQFQDVVEKGKASEYFDWFVVHGDTVSKNRDNYETFASSKGMPKWNTSNPKVQEFLLNIATHYVKEYDIDGWRLDVADEISHHFWRRFRLLVKEAKSDAVIIGENWHDASNYLRGEQFDSVMNYAFTKVCLDYFATEIRTAQETAWKLNELLMRNTDPVNRMMLNLLDSHDTHRFFTRVGENPGKAKAALALLYLFVGTPCIYYGTEILMPGEHDPDCRRCMDWTKAGPEGEFSDIHALLGTLAKVRRENKLADWDVRVDAVGEVLHLVRSAEAEAKTEAKADKVDPCGQRRELHLWMNNTAKEQSVKTQAAEARTMQPYSFFAELDGKVIIEG